MIPIPYVGSAQTMRSQQHRAFTLVELLVVISIIALLMALLIPAVTGAVQASKSAQCKNNLREIASGMRIFESKKQRFPGYIERVFNTNRSWAIGILPQIGHGDIYDAYQGFPADQEREEAVALYVCPADSHPVSGWPWLSYKVTCGQDDNDVTPSRAHGIFHNRAPGVLNIPIDVTVGYIQSADGAANTLLVGEDLRAWQYHGKVAPDGNVTEYMTGFLWEPDSAIQPINRTVSFPGGQIVNNPNNDNANYQLPFDVTGDDVLTLDTPPGPNHCRLSSHHPGGANAAFADGHVQLLSQNISADVYAKLCTPEGRLSNQTPLSETDWNYNSQ